MPARDASIDRQPTPARVVAPRSARACALLAAALAAVTARAEEPASYDAKPGEPARHAERVRIGDLRLGPQLNVDVIGWHASFDMLLQRTTAPAPTRFGYRWDARRPGPMGFEIGIQGLGSIGDLRRPGDPAERWHQWGPAMFANWPVGVHRNLRLDGSWLAGVDTANPRGALRVQAQLDY